MRRDLTVLIVGSGAREHALYIVWMIYNAVDDGFQAGSIVELVAVVGMMCLLGLNIFLLWNVRQP